jgi:CRISPR type IV-associated protein Csf3
MATLQIDCQLSGPWCPPQFGLHLDGLVARALVGEQLEGGSDAGSYEAILADLPFEQDESGVWKASQFFPVGWLGQQRRYVTGKTPVQHLALSIGAGIVDAAGGSIIDTVRGIAKDHAGYITIEHVRGLRAWCVGDEDAIREYLDRMPAIGARTRMGFGTLRPYENESLWRITSCEDAAENWKLRSAPKQITAQSYPSLGSWRPPYWRGGETIWRPIPMRLDV